LCPLWWHLELVTLKYRRGQDSFVNIKDIIASVDLSEISTHTHTLVYTTTIMGRRHGRVVVLRTCLGSNPGGRGQWQ